MSAISSILKTGYRYIRYGKQLGKTSANGTKVYQRGLKSVAIDSKGDIRRIIKRTIIDSDSYRYKTLDFLKDGTIIKTRGGRIILNPLSKTQSGWWYKKMYNKNKNIVPFFNKSYSGQWHMDEEGISGIVDMLVSKVKNIRTYF